jgi:O-antigen/teichoic acid export membrane protein
VASFASGRILKILSNKYFKNTYWLILEKFLRLFAAIFVGALVARYLGPTDLGQLNFAHSFVMIFSIFITLGMDSVAVKAIVDSNHNENSILGTVFGLKLLSGTVSFFIIILLTYLLGYTQSTKIYIGIVGLIQIIHCFTVLDLYFQAKVKSKMVVISNVISLIVSTILRLAFIFLKLDVFWFISVFTIEALVMTFCFNIAYRSQGVSILNWSFDKNLAKKLISKSWPLILSGLTVSIYMKVDQLMIKELLNFTELGYYSAALKLSETWYFLPMVISASFFPSLVNSYENKDVYRKRFQLLYDGLFILSLGLSICTTFISPYLIDLLYGVDYKASATVLSLQIWASVFVFAGVAGGKWFVVNHKEKILMYLTTGSCILNIILNYIFIPKYGINAAAITTIVSQAFSALVGMFFFYKECKENIIFILKSFNIFSSIKRILSARNDF